MDSEQIKAMQAKIAAAVQEEQAALAPPAPAEDPPLDPAFVRACLHNEERGDGILYANLHQDKFVLVKNWGRSGAWLHWTGHHWEEDKKDLAHNAVEQVAAEYHRYLLHLDPQKKAATDKLRAAEDALKRAEDNKDTPIEEVIKLQGEKNKALSELAAVKGEQKKATTRIDKLRKMGGAVNCLEWSHRIGAQSLAILGDELDLNPWLLPCPNGVLDLKTAKFSPGRPRDYLLRAISVPWLGIDHPCPTWDAMMDEIHLGDQEIIAYLDRLFGYSLTGLTTEHFIGFFLGEGRNGKGTMFELLRYLMGDLGWAISPELILEQKNARNSAGPSPDLMSLHGRRMVIASESDEHRRVSISQVKRLTGADTIPARAPHDRFETNITPTWKIFFYTNHVPANITREFALVQRLVYLKYPLKFVDEPDPRDPYQRQKDPDLPAKLKAEASGILARLVRGCLQYQQMGGLHPPAKIRADVADLAKTQDTFQMFWAEMVHEDAEAWVPFKQLYDAFAAWYADEIGDSDKYRPTKKAVSAWLERRGFERRKPSGVATVYGCRLACVLGDRP
jgi:putative DNA primase/helicase